MLMQMKPLIAIQGAMDGEVIALLEAMETYKEEKFGTYSFYIGKIDSMPLIVSRSEIGMANAAASTTLLIDKYHPDVIINQGTAGGHDPNLRVFDTIIGEEIIHINSFMSPHRDKEEGMSPENWIPMHSFIREEDGRLEEKFVFKSDPELLAAARDVVGEYSRGKVVVGKIGTADFWNREIDRIYWFHQHFHTSGEEMEAYAVAQIAAAFKVPFLSIRTISNSEVTDDGIEDLDMAGRYCAEFSLQVAKKIYQQESVSLLN